MDSQDLDALIDDLDEEVAALDSRNPDWDGVWTKIKKIGASFKQTRYRTRDQHQAAWQRFQSIVEQVKERQSASFERRKAFAARSATHLSHIESFAEAASSDGGLGDLMLFMATAGISLITKAAFDAVLGEEDEELKRLKERSEAMQLGWAYLTENKAEMIAAHKSTAFDLLQETQEALNGDWEEWKETKRRR